MQKECYEEPELIVYGDLEELTQYVSADEELYRPPSQI